MHKVLSHVTLGVLAIGFLGVGCQLVLTGEKADKDPGAPLGPDASVGAEAGNTSAASGGTSAGGAGQNAEAGGAGMNGGTAGDNAAGATASAGSGGTSGTASAGAGGKSPLGEGCSSDMPFIKWEEVKELNTLYDDWNARLSPDALSIYFTSDRARGIPSGVGGAGGVVTTDPVAWSDIYEAKRTRLIGENGAPEPFANLKKVEVLSRPVASDGTRAGGEFNAGQTADGLSAFFDSYRPGRRQVFRATRGRREDDWSTFEELTSLASDGAEAREFEPYVTPNGGALYFTSNRWGADPDWDLNIFRARIENGRVYSPSELEFDIPVVVSERAPVISPDELTIYFASDREIPDTKIGTYEIWTATRLHPNDAFTNVRPLTELASTGYDAPTWISSDGCTLYFYTDRGGGRGNKDLYRAYRR